MRPGEIQMTKTDNKAHAPVHHLVGQQYNSLLPCPFCGSLADNNGDIEHPDSCYIVQIHPNNLKRFSSESRRIAWNVRPYNTHDLILLLNECLVKFEHYESNGYVKAPINLIKRIKSGLSNSLMEGRDALGDSDSQVAKCTQLRTDSSEGRP
jgi:hypothetical protein